MYLAMAEIKSKYMLYAFMAILTILIVASFVLIKPFLTAVIASFILVYFFYPLYRKINTIVGNKSLSSLLMLIIIGLIIIVPLGLLARSLSSQAVDFYFNLKNIDVTPVSNLVSKYTDIDLRFYFQDLSNKGIAYVIKTASNFLFSLPQIIVSLFVMVFTMYYLFKDGPNFIEKVKAVLPLREKQKDHLISQFDAMMHATVYGLFITALLQGIIGTIGLVVFGISSPILLGSAMAVAAMLPYFGTAVVWLPTSLYKIFVADDLFNGVGLLVYSIVLTSNIDNFLKPRLISRKSRVHPVLILLGIFGGVRVFGLLGIIIGPIIFTLSLAFLEFLKMEIYG